MSQLSLPVTAVEGVGPATERKLADAGVVVVADLLTRPAQFVDSVVGKDLSSFRAAAEMLRVDGLTPDHAEAFVDAGIDGLVGLAEAGLQTLERACDAAVAANKLDVAPSLYKLAEFQREAADLRSEAAIVGLLTVAGQPVAADTRVTAGRYRTVVDSSGRFVLDGLPARQTQVWVHVAGRPIPHGFSVKVEAGQVVGRSVDLPKAADDHDFDRVSLHERDGMICTPTRSTRWRPVWGELSELDSGVELVVSAVGKHARLLDLFGTRIGSSVLIRRYRPGDSDLPDGVQPGDVVEWTGSGFAASETSVETLRAMRLVLARQARPTTSRRVITIGGAQ